MTSAFIGHRTVLSGEERQCLITVFKVQTKKTGENIFQHEIIELFRNYFTKVASQHADCECNSTQLIQCGKVDLGTDHKKSDGGVGKKQN